jgi:cytochrome c oxidase subunit 4
VSEHETSGSETRVETEEPVSGEEREHPNYLAVWAGLALLTLLEVGVAFVDLSRMLIVLVLLGLAVWKALLVALYFMHLRFEPRRVVMVAVAPLPLAAILMLAVLAEF